VEDARVGQRTDLEKLIIDVQTNGALTAEEGMQFAAQLLRSYFDYFCSAEKRVEADFIADFSRSDVQAGAHSFARPRRTSHFVKYS